MNLRKNFSKQIVFPLFFYLVVGGVLESLLICLERIKSYIYPCFLVPEFTTMAGRRLRDAVKLILLRGGSKDFGGNAYAVIAGLTNTYSQYVATFEEYEIQRYEVSYFTMAFKGCCV